MRVYFFDNYVWKRNYLENRLSVQNAAQSCRLKFMFQIQVGLSSAVNIVTLCAYNFFLICYKLGLNDDGVSMSKLRFCQQRKSSDGTLVADVH